MLKKLFVQSAISATILFIAGWTHAEENNSSNNIAATNVHITQMGRAEKTSDGSARFSYPGVTFMLNTKADSLSMVASSNSGNGWLDIIVDETTPNVIQLSKEPQTYELFHFPTIGKHTVRIINRTETWQAINTINKFELNKGEFLTASKLPSRKLMVLGDSVTCAEMIDRVPGEKPNARWNNARESYGMLIATALHAQVQLVCMGGHGLVRTWDNKTNSLNLADFYPLAIPNEGSTVAWDEKLYEPDVIVSAIGTNDFSPGIPDREHYVNTYVKFLLKVLADHKHAQIFITEGAILNGEKKAVLVDYLTETLKRVNDKRVHIATSTYYPGDNTDAHPTKEQHAAMAKDLEPQIKKVMEW